MSNEKLPEIIVFAGPNGSGKTTITKNDFWDKTKIIELIGKTGAEYDNRSVSTHFI